VRLIWQTFGRLRLDPIRFWNFERDYSNAFVNVYGDENDYVL